LSSFENFRRNGGRQQTKEVADQRAMEVRDSIQVARWRNTRLGRVQQLRLFISVVAEDEAEQQAGHNLLLDLKQINEQLFKNRCLNFKCK